MTLIYCPCQSGARYAECCARFHDGEPAPSAELLMRARYSAYALKRVDYVNATWHPDTLNGPVTKQSLGGIEWIGLTVHEAMQLDDTHATVTFTAIFHEDDQHPIQLTEKSRFVLENGQWLYVDGVHS